MSEDRYYQTCPTCNGAGLAPIGAAESEIDWKKVADGLRAEADRIEKMAEANPHLDLARITAPAIVTLRGIAQAIYGGLK